MATKKKSSSSTSSSTSTSMNTAALALSRSSPLIKTKIEIEQVLAAHDPLLQRVVLRVLLARRTEKKKRRGSARS